MTEDKVKEWREVHQKFELEYHQADNYRWDDEGFKEAWVTNFDGFLNLKPDHFKPDDILLDIGCGSRPAFSYFTSGVIHNIDPLGNEYLKIPQVKKYWPIQLIETQYPIPAESRIRYLVGQCSFVNCWNCLDHSYDWRAIIENMILYTKPGGIISLCTDTKPHGAGHPGIDDVAEMLDRLWRHFKIERIEINYGDTVKRDIALKGRKL